MNRVKLLSLVALGASALALSTCGQEPPASVPPDAAADGPDAAAGLPCTYPSDCALGDCLQGRCVECVSSSCTNGTVCSVDRKCVRPDAGSAGPADASVVPTGDTGVPECADRSACASGLICKDGKCQGCVSGLECAAHENCIGNRCVATSEPDGGPAGPDAAVAPHDGGATPGPDAGGQADVDSGVVDPPDAGNGCDPSCQNCVFGFCLDGNGDGGSGCQCDAGTCILGMCLGGGSEGDAGSSCQPECDPGVDCIFGRCVKSCDAGCDPGGSCILGHCVGGGSNDGGSGCNPECLPGQTCVAGLFCYGTPIDAGSP